MILLLLALQTVEEFAARRDAVRAELPEKAALVWRSSRHVEEFKIDKDFYWLTGVADESATLVMTREATILYVPARSPEGEVWDGYRLYPGEEAARATGIDDVRDLKEFALPEGKLYMARRLDDPEDERIVDPRPMIAARRLIKSEAEMSLLREAIETTGHAHIEAMRRIEAGMRERALAGHIERVFREGDCEENGFESIVGSGPNSCILHYRAGSREMQDGDLVVIDIGAEYRQYTADVTRTIPVSGRFTERQAQIYNLVLKAQQAAAEGARPGMTLRDIHKIAAGVLADGLIELKMIESADNLRRYFMHGTSHWLGLDVHDVGGREAKAEVGSVFTIEPGIYIAEEELGVRIEDDYVMTADGARCLSDRAPRTVEEIERMMGRRR